MQAEQSQKFSVCFDADMLFDAEVAENSALYLDSV